MKQRGRKILLRKLLIRGRHNKRLWPALILLCVGMVMLLFAVQLYTGYRDVLSGRFDKTPRTGTYIVINKEISSKEKITEQEQALFSSKEIRTLAALKGVQDVGMVAAAQFPIEVELVGVTDSFSTSLFLEAIPERFIDNKPVDWYWQPNSAEVPVILSTEFMNLYNFGYAPNQGVPQLTRGTIKTLDFKLTIGTGIKAEEFKARVVGFTDRVSSILVPERFIEYGNMLEDIEITPFPSRLILLVNDPSNKQFVDYITTQGYEVNKEHLRWSHLRGLLDLITKGIGLLAIIILVVSLYMLVLFTQLTLSKARDNYQLLVDLGYSPSFLNRFMYTRYILILIGVTTVVGISSIIVQVRLAKYLLEYDLSVATFPAWEVWAVLVFLLLSLTIVWRVFIKKSRMQ